MAEQGDYTVLGDCLERKTSVEAVPIRYENNGSCLHGQVKPSCSTSRRQVRVKGVFDSPVKGVRANTEDVAAELAKITVENNRCQDGQREDFYRTRRQQIRHKGETCTPETGVAVTRVESENRHCLVRGNAGSGCYTYCSECGGAVVSGCSNCGHNSHFPVRTEDGFNNKQRKTKPPHESPHERLVLKKLDSLEESLKEAEKERKEIEEQIIELRDEAIRSIEESAKTLLEQVRYVYDRWRRDVAKDAIDSKSHLRGCHGNAWQEDDVKKLQQQANIQRHAPQPPVVEFVPQAFERSVFTLGRIRVTTDKEVDSPRRHVPSTRARTSARAFTPSRFGTSGTERGQFTEPLCITTALDQVYVIDRSGGGRVQVFTLWGEPRSEFFLNLGEGLTNINGCGLVSDGRHVSFVGSIFRGTLGVDTTYTNVFAKYGRDGRVVAKRVLAIGSDRDPIIDASSFPDSRLAALLTGKVCILATNGDTLREFDTAVQTYKRVCVDPGNNNIVLSLHDKIQVYNEQGRRLRDLSLQPGPSNGPHGLCVDGRGNIIVADWSDSRVRLYGRDGAFVKTVAGEEDGLVCPWALAVPRKGCVVVADWRHHCVFVFRY